MSTTGERPYLSIGEVLELLKEEFPDVSISRIRQLESQGLLQLERTASGYRKFYDGDVTHLRTILRSYGPGDGVASPAAAVRPPRVEPRASSFIDLAGSSQGSAGNGAAGNLVAGDGAEGADGADGDDDAVEVHNGELPGQPERRHPASFNVARRAAPTRSVRPPAAPPTGRTSGAAGDPTGGQDATEMQSEPPVAVAPVDTSGESAPALLSGQVPGMNRHPAGAGGAIPAEDLAAASAATTTEGRHLALVNPPAPSAPMSGSAATEQPAEPATVAAELGSRNPLAVNPSALSLSLDDLCRAAGVAAEQVRELEGYGLLRGHTMFSTVYYDEDALLTCRLVAEFLRFGVEPRHLRMYKLAADREAAFFEQVVTPQLRRRNADAKEKAIETLGELVRLGEQLRVVALRQVLRAAVDPS